MKINFNVNGDRRKALVREISDITNQPLCYKGAPTFVYEVGGYTIGKDGMVTGEGSIGDTSNSELLKALSALGFIGEVIDQGDDAQAELPEPDAFEPEFSDKLTIEIPKDGFTETSLANLERMVASKASLIKKALGQNLADGAENLPIEQTETTLRFPWFRLGLEPEAISAYARFIGALCATAKKLKRITATEKDVDNERYAFRCFMLRLGFIGEDYKQARRVLLAGLDGNTAFKRGRAPKKTR